MRQNKSGLIIMFLIIIVVLLLGIVAYTLFVKPYLFKKQVGIYNQGYEQAMIDAVALMFNDIQQKGYTQIFANNQTLVLAPVQLEQPTE